MASSEQASYFLYHLRDPETSSGTGFDGYVGITADLRRRGRQHFAALERGNHPNQNLQLPHDASEDGLLIWLVTSGPEREILSRERLLVPKANHHLNGQVGGGRLRGMTEEEAIRNIFKRNSESSTSGRGFSASGNKRESHVPGGFEGMARMGAAASGGSGGASAPSVGIRAAFSGLGLAALGLGLGLAASGSVSAVAINRTVLRDDVGLDPDERNYRKAGRTGSVIGAGIGLAGTMGLIGASGSVVGLSGAGIGAGVVAIGGGSVVAGVFIVAALPAAAAAATGYGLYRLVKRAANPVT